MWTWTNTNTTEQTSGRRWSWCRSTRCVFLSVEALLSAAAFCQTGRPTSLCPLGTRRTSLVALGWTATWTMWSGPMIADISTTHILSGSTRPLPTWVLLDIMSSISTYTAGSTTRASSSTLLVWLCWLTMHFVMQRPTSDTPTVSRDSGKWIAISITIPFLNNKLII